MLLRHRNALFSPRILSHFTLVSVLTLFTVVGPSHRNLLVSAQSLQPSDATSLEVLKVLRSKGEAHVVIALREQSVTEIPQRTLDQLRQHIATQQDAVLAVLSPSEFQLTHKYESIPALAGRLLTESGLNKLRQNPAIVRIDLDVGGSGDLANTVPLIGANTWHAKGFLGSGVVVAVLDSGLDTDHSDLATALIHQECFLDENGVIDGRGLCPNGSDRQSGVGAAEDDAGHGTHVTGIIASRGTLSSPGVAPGASIVSIKVTAGPSFSGVFFYFSEILAALDYLINSRSDVKIVNMSLGTTILFTGDCDNSTAYNIAGAAAINVLRMRGTITFASSGNNGSGTQMPSPACLSNVISVGATNNADSVAAFANSNASTDVFAPGVGVRSSDLANSTAIASGTSMASPHAAGCAALLVQGGEATTPDQIEARLESSPVQVIDLTNGLSFPRVDCSLKSLASVALVGPFSGTTNVAYSFVATINPITATQPFTYVWQATHQNPVTHTTGLTDTISFTWSVPGLHVLTTTITNAASVISNTHTIAIHQLIYLPLVVR